MVQASPAGERIAGVRSQQAIVHPTVEAETTRIDGFCAVAMAASALCVAVQIRGFPATTNGGAARAP